MTSLLFDENLSHKLPAKLADVYPGSAHVRHVGLLGAGDERVWEYALRNGLVIVSKDETSSSGASCVGLHRRSSGWLSAMPRRARS